MALDMKQEQHDDSLQKINLVDEIPDKDLNSLRLSCKGITGKNWDLLFTVIPLLGALEHVIRTHLFGVLTEYQRHAKLPVIPETVPMTF